VTLEGVRAHQQSFQDIADANNGIRASGTSGYDESVNYVATALEDAGYDVTVQPFQHYGFVNLGSSIIEQTNPGSTTYIENIDFNIMTHSDSGDVSASVMAVDISLGLGNSSTSGCEQSDFEVPKFQVGDIALIQRGGCTFRLKAENAATAGAVGVILFNQGNTTDRQDVINATLSVDYQGGIPVIFTTYSLGELLFQTAGLEMRLKVDVLRGLIESSNVFAESLRGDPSNIVMAGAHLDSVSAGPGINDNGSGSAALMETAIQMAKVKPRNKVRFAWWGSEEAGLLGSTHFVNSLAQEDKDNIALYLNFDMIASPNYVFFVYDGDGSDGLGSPSGPEGSAEIEKLFETYYDAIEQPFLGTQFSGNSDYGPFIQAGIPSGGIFTGASGIKSSDEALMWGGTAGDQYDPCYHLACDTFNNASLEALDINSDAMAFSVLQFAMDTKIINGKKGKGNFKRTYNMDYIGSLLQR